MRKKTGTEDGQGKQTTSKEALANAAQSSTGLEAPGREAQTETARAPAGSVTLSDILNVRHTGQL